MTARFVVSLYLLRNPDVRVTQAIRRGDTERAVSYARHWLKRSRLSGYYLGEWYNAWEVVESDVDGEPAGVTRGIDDTEYKPDHGRARQRAATRRRLTSELGSVYNQHGPSRRAAGTLSPFQERIRAAVTQAKTRAASNGIITAMGSDSHNQK